MIYKKSHPTASDTPAIFPEIGEQPQSSSSITAQEASKIADPNNDGIISVKEAKSAAKRISKALTNSQNEEAQAMLFAICSTDPREFAKEAAKSPDGTTTITYTDSNSNAVRFKISEEAIIAGIKSLCEGMDAHPEEESPSPPKSIPTRKPRTEMLGRH